MGEPATAANRGEPAGSLFTGQAMTGLPEIPRGGAGIIFVKASAKGEPEILLGRKRRSPDSWKRMARWKLGIRTRLTRVA
jgi:hypothetical protein